MEEKIYSKPIKSTTGNSSSGGSAKEKSTPIIVLLLIVILLIGAGGVYAGMQISKKQTPVVLPTAPPPNVRPTETVPTSIPDETAEWKTYKNEKYGFEFKYPKNLSYVSSGPNSAQKEVDQGKELSGTVVPSFDNINFKEGDNNKRFSVEIFKENEIALTPENYQNGLYMSGSCDLRWLDDKPSVVKNIKLNGNNFLEVNVTGPKQYVNCYYLKSRNSNLIVISSEIFTNGLTFNKINGDLVKILSTFKFLD